LRRGDGGIVPAPALRDRAMASSSSLLERRRLRSGPIRTPHLDRDRRPVPCDATISIVAATCALADAMTKVAIADPALAAAMLAARGGHILVDGVPIRIEIARAA
jgi:thiamine biosynthesis lipoprotein